MRKIFTFVLTLICCTFWFAAEAKIQLRSATIRLPLQSTKTEI